MPTNESRTESPYWPPGIDARLAALEMSLGIRPTPPTSSSESGSLRPRESLPPGTESGFWRFEERIRILGLVSSSSATIGSPRNEYDDTPTGPRTPVSRTPSARSRLSGYLRSSSRLDLITVPICTWSNRRLLTATEWETHGPEIRAQMIRELCHRGARVQEVRIDTYYDIERDVRVVTVSAPVPDTTDPAIRRTYSNGTGRSGNWFTVPRPRAVRTDVPQPPTRPATPRTPSGFQRAAPGRPSPYFYAESNPGSAAGNEGRGAGDMYGLAGPSAYGIIRDEYESIPSDAWTDQSLPVCGEPGGSGDTGPDMAGDRSNVGGETNT